MTTLKHNITILATVFTLALFVLGVGAQQANAESAVKQDESTHATGWGSQFAYGGEVLSPGDSQYTLGGDVIWTPGLTGTFDVDASWAAGHTAHGPNTSYYFRSDGTPGSEVLIVGGIDQENFASGAFPIQPGTQWSGWYGLGQFALNPSSTFRISEATNTNLTNGMWRFSDPGSIRQDESTHASSVEFGGIFDYATGGAAEPEVGDNKYGLDGGDGDIFWTPGLTGTFDVDAAWAAGHTAHGPDARYYFRPDGTPGSEVLITGPIDQENLADGTFPTAGTSWSGFYGLGQFSLNPSSTFRINGSTLTTGSWQFTPVAVDAPAVPEPSTFMLAALGLLSLGFAGRRSRTTRG